MSQICQCPTCEQFLAIPQECADDAQICCPKCQGQFSAAELRARQAVVAPVIVAPTTETSPVAPPPETETPAAAVGASEEIQQAELQASTEPIALPTEPIPSEQEILVGDDQIVGSEETSLVDEEPVALDFLGGPTPEIASASGVGLDAAVAEPVAEIVAAEEPVLAQESTPCDESLPPVEPVPPAEMPTLAAPGGSIMEPTAQFDAAPAALSFGAAPVAATPTPAPAASPELDGWAAFGMLPSTAPGAAAAPIIPAPYASQVAAPGVLPDVTAPLGPSPVAGEGGYDAAVLGVPSRFQATATAVAPAPAAAPAAAGVGSGYTDTGIARQRISSRLRIEEKSLARQLLSNLGMVVFGILGLLVSYYVICFIAGPQMNFLRLPFLGNPSAAARSAKSGSDAAVPVKKKKSENPFAIQEGSAFPDIQRINELKEEEKKAGAKK